MPWCCVSKALSKTIHIVIIQVTRGTAAHLCSQSPCHAVNVVIKPSFEKPPVYCGV